MIAQQEKGSDPPFEDHHRAFLAWWITQTRPQSSGKDADRLFHSRHVTHHTKKKKKKKIGHMDTLL